MPEAVDFDSEANLPHLRLRRQLREGIANLKAGNLGAARTTFSQVIETSPESAAGHLGLGRVHLQEKDLQAALQCFQTAVTLDPTSSVAKALLARVRERIGDFDTAIQYYDEASEMDPSLGFAQRRVSRLFAQNKDYGEAVDRLREALKHNPQQVATRLMLANSLERSGDRAAAKAELQRVLELKPEMWIAAYRLGRLHLRDEEMSVARPLFEQAIRLAPDKSAPRVALAAVLKGVGDHDKALAVLEEAQKLSSNNPSMVSMMVADCQIKLGRPEEAFKSLRQALRGGRNPGVLHKRLGDVLITLGKYRDAIDEYRAALLRQPELAEQQPALRSLMEKAQTPGGDPEALAKEVQGLIASISAAKRAAIKGNDNLSGLNIRRARGVRRFSQLTRKER
jgi:tetratricopeptide (TPR) repeat protein